MLDAVAAAEGPAVLGLGWSPAAGTTPPSPQELLRASGGRPVLLLGADLDTAVATAGVRGDDGEDVMAGLAIGAALDALAAQVPGSVERGLAAAAAAGVVAVHEHSLPTLESRQAIASLIEAAADDASGVPLVVGYRAELCETTDDAHDVLAEIPGLTGIGGSLAVDGTPGRLASCPTGALRRRPRQRGRAQAARRAGGQPRRGRHQSRRAGEPGRAR